MPRKKDYAEKETDEMLSDLEKKIDREYRIAYREVSDKFDKFVEGSARREAEKRALVEAGQMTEKEFLNWKAGQTFISDRWKNMRDELAEDLVRADLKALSMTKGFLPEAYALNHNYGTYEIEKGTSINTAYTLYSRETVERLLKDNPKLLPDRKLDIPKDKIWNRQHINSAIVQGVLQGDDLKSISKRLRAVTDMDRRGALRNARTMMTGAQNAGRLDAYKRAQALGIEVQKEWMATLDHYTRDSHARLDGEKVALDEKFSNGLMFPGDPKGEPSEVYNCRCTMVADTPEYPDTDMMRYDNVAGKSIKNVTYSEWAKTKPQDTMPAKFKIAEGKDLSKVWERRKDQYDFEIEDVINAQGFDGLPRVVSPEEFDKLVAEANDGNGFVAQRTYSAPNQETLDAYRDQLYKGKWYVDCSAGGAQYGQGMYCAADWSGKITDGMRNEMKHYQQLGYERLGEISLADLKLISKAQKEKADEFVRLFKEGKMSREQGIALYKEVKSMQPTEFLAKYMKDSKISGTRAYTETLTLDKSAKIIKHNDLYAMKSTYAQKKAYEAIDAYGKAHGEDVSAFFRIQTGRSIEGDWGKAASLDANNHELFQEANDFYVKQMQKASKDTAKYASMDDGAFATMLGYDAINAEGHGESGSYTVILNRTKVIIRGE